MKWVPFTVKKNQSRDTGGKFVSEEPLVQVTVSNPIAKLQNWLTKLISNEGVDLKVRIHPLTAIIIAGVLTLGGFGLGRFSLPPTNPIVKYIPQLVEVPTPTPNIWRETAFSGLLRYSSATKKFYLEITLAEAITLEVPATVILAKYVGRRIFATGNLNIQTGVLFVTDATDLELLPTQQNLIPTIMVSPTPTSTPTE